MSLFHENDWCLSRSIVHHQVGPVAECITVHLNGGDSAQGKRASLPCVKRPVITTLLGPFRASWRRWWWFQVQDIGENVVSLSFCLLNEPLRLPSVWRWRAGLAPHPRRCFVLLRLTNPRTRPSDRTCIVNMKGTLQGTAMQPGAYTVAMTNLVTALF